MSDNNTPLPSLKELSFTDLLFDNGSFSAQIEGELRPLDEQYTPHAERLLALCIAHPNDNDEGFKITYDGMSFRCTELENINADSCFVLRKLADTVPTWRTLRLSTRMRDVILFGNEYDNNDQKENVNLGGMIVVFGETNSGKSTTVNALIDEIAQLESWLIMSFEDPSEVLFTKTYDTGAKVIQRDIPSEKLSSGLKTALRASARVIKVGEIRDKQAAAMAVDAAQAGFMVLTTMHASSIADGLSRFSKYIGDNKLFEQAFRCCLHQTLVVRPGVSNRLLDYTFLSKTRTVSNLLQDANFKGLEQEIQTQTKHVKKGG
jgi:Tfp pilus assembly pilus retraction ATPase PilT